MGAEPWGWRLEGCSSFPGQERGTCTLRRASASLPPTPGDTGQQAQPDAAGRPQPPRRPTRNSGINSTRAGRCGKAGESRAWASSILFLFFFSSVSSTPPLSFPSLRRTRTQAIAGGHAYTSGWQRSCWLLESCRQPPSCFPSSGISAPVSPSLPSLSPSAHPLEGERHHHPHPVHEQRRPDRRGDESQRGLLLGAWPPLPAQLHLQVQGDGRGGAETALAPRVSQRLPPRRGPAQVRGTALPGAPCCVQGMPPKPAGCPAPGFTSRVSGEEKLGVYGLMRAAFCCFPFQPTSLNWNNGHFKP